MYKIGMVCYKFSVFQMRFLRFIVLKLLLCWFIADISLAKKTYLLAASCQFLAWLICNLTLNVEGTCSSDSGRGVWHELSSLARTLGLWVRIPLEVWMSVCVYSVFMLSSGLTTGWSLVQGVLRNVLGLRNWSETKCFTDAICSKWEQQE
jgi:hypothetical protein